MAWISIERHILIFHPHAMIHVAWKKYVFHFIPIIFCLIWPPIFFFAVVVVNPQCSNGWDFNLLTCGIPCYFTIDILVQFDFIFDIVFPVTIIAFANVTLNIRVIYQKISRHQIINWRRHRKMVIQLWIISSLYIAFWAPTTITQLIQMTVMPSFMSTQLEAMQFVIYLISLLLPMICLSTLPELMNKITSIFKLPHRNAIGTIIFSQPARQPVTTATVRG